MNWKRGLCEPGIILALIAALLFGSSMPLAKVLLSAVNPWLLAGLLYLGSGIGLSLYRLVCRTPTGRLPAADWPWFAGAIFAGGIAAPVLLMFGLRAMPASGASLLLNTEGVLTALLAWLVFRENLGRRIVLGVLAIFAGMTVLSWSPETRFSSLWPVVAVVGACLMWAIDNNLTRKVSLADATWIAMIKGLTSGSVNLVLAAILGATLPSLSHIADALLLGFLAYGVSLALFVVSLRHLGAARASAYFSVAPFFGAALAIPLLGDPVSRKILTAGVLMTLGVWLHLTERHWHEHRHKALEHDHEHVHDLHHLHEHHEPISPGTRHRHRHRHAAMTHEHAHFPDAHHDHEH